MEICVSSYTPGDFRRQSGQHGNEANDVLNMEIKHGKP